MEKQQEQAIHLLVKQPNGSSLSAAPSKLEAGAPGVLSEQQQVSPKMAVVVVGMHRSGTSALTRVLSFLGCDLPKTLMRATEHNEAGHWESQAITDFNDLLLESAGSKWNDWLAFNAGWYRSPKAEEFKKRALPLLNEEFGTSHLFVMKDPRISRLLPFWLDVIGAAGVKPVIVVVMRNPLEVAASLEQRDGFAPALGHLLWLRHVLEAEAASRGRNRFYCCYHALLTEWPVAATRAQEALGLSLPRFAGQVGEEVDAFLTERLRHHRTPPRNVLENPLLSAWLRDAFRIFHRWAEDGERPDDFAELDRIRVEFDAAAPAFARLVASGVRAARKVHELENVQVQLAEKEAALARLANERDALAQSAEAAATAHAEETQRLRAKLGDAGKEVAEKEVALARIAGECDTRAQTAEATATAHAKEAQCLRAELVAAGKELTEKEVALARVVAEHETLAQTAEAAAVAHAEETRRLRAELGASGKKLAENKASLGRIGSERDVLAQTAEAAAAAQADETRRLRAELGAVGEQLAQKEAALAHVTGERDTLIADTRAKLAQGEDRLSQRFGEIATLTRLLREREDTARRAADEAEWLRQTSVVLLGGGSRRGKFVSLLPSSAALALQKFQLKRRGLFDPKVYLKAHPDVARSGADPLRHYINFGIREGRKRG
jgi:hypothetical protein